MSSLVGFFRLTGDRRAAYLRLQGGKASWHEGGRETFDKIEVATGQFQPAEKILSELTGVEKYNLKLRLLDEDGKKHDVFGIVNAEGSSLYYMRDTGIGVDHYQRITEEEALELGYCCVRCESVWSVLASNNYREGPRRSHKLPSRTLQGAASPPGQAPLSDRGSRPGQVHHCSATGPAERVRLLRGGLFPPAEEPLHPPDS